MEIPVTSETSWKSTKKVKAIGAFRVFLNFLQKPNKKKMETSPMSKNLPEVPAAQGVCDLEPGVIVDELETRSQNGSLPMAKRLHSLPEIPKNQISSRIGDHGEDGDDEVFLEESYFEDDYFEDFSSSSSNGGTNVEVHHDLAPFNDDRIDDLGTVNVSHFVDDWFLNLVNSDVIDKNYDKILFPDSDSFEEEKVDIFEEPKRRSSNPLRRHNSMPCLSRESNSCTTRQLNLLSDHSSQLLQKPIPYFGSKPDILTHGDLNCIDFNQNDLDPDSSNCHDLKPYNANLGISNRDILTTKLVPVYKGPTNHTPLDTLQPKETNATGESPILLNTDSTDSYDTNSPKIWTSDFATSNTNTTLPFDKPPVTLETFSVTACPDWNVEDFPVKKFECSKLHIVEDSATRSSPCCGSNTKIPNRETSKKEITNVSGYTVSQSKVQKEVTRPLPMPSDFSNRFSKEEKENFNYKNNRLYHRGSIESGYGSARRSSPDTPFSPVTPPIPSTPASKLHKALPFTSPPMSKLHRGTPLSPRSLNLLDGMLKTSSAPKRTLKPKFIFPSPLPPSPLPYDQNPVPSPAQKPIPSVVSKPITSQNLKRPLSSGMKPIPTPDLNPVLEHNELTSDEWNEETVVTRNQETGPTESMPLCGKSKPIESLGTTSEHTGKRMKLSVPRLELDLSMSINFDINNNINIEQHPQTGRHYLPTTPLGERRIPPSGCHNMADIITPFGKTIQPVCTSSPLWVKMGHRDPDTPPIEDILGRPNGTTPLNTNVQYHKPEEMTPLKTLSELNKKENDFSKVLGPQKSGMIQQETTGRPHSRAIRPGLVFELSPVVAAIPPSANNAQTVVSPLWQLTTPVKAKESQAIVIKPTPERKKKLKRRSARARLHFDERVDENNNFRKNADDDDQSPCQPPSIQGDYVLLKRIADSIISECGCRCRDIFDSCVDLAGLMDCLNTEYSKLVEHYGVQSYPRLHGLRKFIESSKNAFVDFTVQNCLDVVLLSFLVQDMNRIRTSLDFCFENLPRVFKEHGSLAHISPEIVVLLLGNPRRVVNNHQGFPLSYSSSEKEVFKAVVKYVEAIRRKNGRPLDDRIKGLLSTVADPQALFDTSSLQSVQPDLACGAISYNPGTITPKPPRPYHRLVFHQLSPSEHKGRDYFLQSFISSSVQSLDQISSNSKNGTSSPVPLAGVCKENYILRKLYFSYRRHNSVPCITKIGMQYSCKGKKKTAFIAPSQPAGPGFGTRCQTTVSQRNKSSGNERQSEMHEAPCASGSAASRSTEMSVVKKACVVLKPGEHIVALSVIGRSVVHNVEVVTNAGRRIRAHGLDDVANERWVAMETPQGRESFCLHAIYGDVHTAAGRSCIRDLGTIWATTSYEAMTSNNTVTSLTVSP